MTFRSLGDFNVRFAIFMGFVYVCVGLFLYYVSIDSSFLVFYGHWR